MTTIDQLPVELMMKIFSYLPSYDRVCLVNKHFYNVACSVSDSKVCRKFIIDPYLLDSPKHRSMMESVQKTNRKISKVIINLAILWDNRRYKPMDFYKLIIADIVKILKQFSATIKHLKLDFLRLCADFRIERSDIIEILSLVPNAENLEMIDVYQQALNQTREQTDYVHLALDQLKTLEIENFDREFPDVFNRLPPGILKELNVSHCDLKLAIGFLTKQPNIKKLTLYDVSGPHNIFDHLKLESFSLSNSGNRGYDSTHLAHILSKQIQLTSLSLRRVQFNKNALDVITNQLSELVTLGIDCGEMDGTLVESFKRIAKLKKLKELTLKPYTLEIINALSGLDNSQITNLRLKDISPSFRDRRYQSVPINVTSALARSMTNLKSLAFDCGCPLTMQLFNFVEVLEMRFDQNIDAESFSEALDVEKCFNPKLTALSIDGHFKWNIFTIPKLIAMYPNLNRLRIIDTDEPLKMPYNAELILNGFQKINSLNLRHDNGWEMTGKLFESLIKHKDRLKLTEFRKLTQLRPDHKRELIAAFDVVKFVQGNLSLKN